MTSNKLPLQRWRGFPPPLLWPRPPLCACGPRPPPPLLRPQPPPCGPEPSPPPPLPCGVRACGVRAYLDERRSQSQPAALSSRSNLTKCFETQLSCYYTPGIAEHGLFLVPGQKPPRTPRPPRRMRPRREKACPRTRAPPDRPALGGGAPLATARGTPLPAHPALRTPLASPGATPLTVMKNQREKG